jgi:hypothetical protein
MAGPSRFGYFSFAIIAGLLSWFVMNDIKFDAPKTGITGVLDRDADGDIDRNDLLSLLLIDCNKNGKLDQQDAQACAKAIFTLLDHNHDGELNKNDLVQLIHNEFDPASPTFNDTHLDQQRGGAPFPIQKNESAVAWWCLLPFRLVYFTVSLCVEIFLLSRGAVLTEMISFFGIFIGVVFLNMCLLEEGGDVVGGPPRDREVFLVFILVCVIFGFVHASELTMVQDMAWLLGFVFCFTCFVAVCLGYRPRSRHTAR